MTDYQTTNRHLFLNSRSRVRDHLKTAAGVALFILAFGIVGRMDYDDAVAMEAMQQAQQPQVEQLASAAPTVCNK